MAHVRTVAKNPSSGLHEDRLPASQQQTVHPQKTSGLAYQIANSLASVRSLSEILRDYPGIDPIQRQRFLNVILYETEKVGDLVNKIAPSAEPVAATS